MDNRAKPLDTALSNKSPVKSGIPSSKSTSTSQVKKVPLLKLNNLHESPETQLPKKFESSNPVHQISPPGVHTGLRHSRAKPQLSEPKSNIGAGMKALEDNKEELQDALFLKLGFPSQKSQQSEENLRINPERQEMKQDTTGTGKDDALKTRQQIENEMLRQLQMIQDQINSGNGEVQKNLFSKVSEKESEMMEVDSKSDKSAQSPKGNAAHGKKSHQRQNTLHQLDELIANERLNTLDINDVSSSSEEEDQVQEEQKVPQKEAQKPKVTQRPKVPLLALPQITQASPLLLIREDLQVTPRKEKLSDRQFTHQRMDSLSSLQQTAGWGEMIQKSQFEINVSKQRDPKQIELEIQLEGERKRFQRAMNLDVNIKKGEKEQFPQAKKDKVYSFLQYQNKEQENLMMGRRSMLNDSRVKGSELNDLLQYLICGNFRIHSLVASDYELSKSLNQYQKLLQIDSRRTDATFGIGISLFYMLDYQGAQENFLKVLNVKPSDGTCLVWFGISLLYYSIQVTSKVSRMTNKTDIQYKNLIMSREKALQDCVKILQKCRRIKEVALQANFALLILSFTCLEQFPPLKVPGLKESEEYSHSIKELDQYYGYIAWAMTCQKFKGPEKALLGQNALQELIDGNTQRPEAYLALWSVEYSIKKNFVNALNIAEQLFVCATDYQSFHEKLLITIIYAKSLRRAGEPLKAFTLLQLEYSKAPHYTSLLYLYGKYAVTSDLSEFYGSAIGALDECLRQCLPHRHQKIKYFIGVAYQNDNRRLRAYLNFKQFLNQNVYLQEQSLSKLENIATFLNRFDSNFYLKVGEVYEELQKNKELPLERIPIIKSMNLYYLYQKVWDSDPYEADLFKAIFQYKVFNEIANSEALFQRLIKEYAGNCVEAQLEYLRLLKRAGNIKGASQLSKVLLEKIDNEQVHTTLWVQAHIEIAKLENQNNQIEDALELLMKLRQVLPPIDMSQIDDFKMPFNIDDYHERPLCERAQNLFQEGLYVIDEYEEDEERKTGPSKKRNRNNAEDDEGFDFGKDSEHNFRNTLELRQDEAQRKHVYSSFITDQDFKEEDHDQIKQPAVLQQNFQYERNQTQEDRTSIKFGTMQRMTKLSNGNESHFKGQVKDLSKRSTSIMFFAQAPSNAIAGIHNSQPSQTGFESDRQMKRTTSIRSSMPKVALLNILQQKQSQDILGNIGSAGITSSIILGNEMADQNLELEAVNEYMKDTNFSVFSDPKFLYIMGKICARSGLILYADLAIQSFHDYFLIITYYKNYLRDQDYLLIKIKTYIWIAKVFLHSGQLDDCEKMLNEIYLDCLQQGDSLFLNFELVFSQLHRTRGVLLRQNLITNHFYSMHHKPANDRYLN